MPSRGSQPGRLHNERDAFFRDLRALRKRHGLDLSEIAERTRFPLDMLAAAETGPELPSLPTLSAYLRGCGESLTSWEDRWRRLAPETVPADNGLPVRNAGTSPLASAGAAVAGADAPVRPLGPGSSTIPAQPAYTIKRLGHRHRRPWRQSAAFSRRYATVAAGAAVALLAVGGTALLAANQAPGHRVPAIAASPTRTASPPAQRAPSAGPAPASPKHPRAPGTRCPPTCPDVAGVGCCRTKKMVPSPATRPPGPDGPRRAAGPATAAMTGSS